jgi:hypothetical protein
LVAWPPPLPVGRVHSEKAIVFDRPSVIFEAGRALLSPKMPRMPVVVGLTASSRLSSLHLSPTE